MTISLQPLRCGLLLLVLALASPLATPTHAFILQTTDPAAAAAFLAGADLESFDDLSAFSITSYGPGQTIDPGARFNSRDGSTQPTFNSGGGSFNDPVGNPGAPIGIFAPSGGIVGDVISGAQVAGPLVIFTDEPFNNGFMEVIFASEVQRVGFWVTHGAVALDLRDATGNVFTTGDFSATVSAGEFIGIERDAAEIKIAALFASGTDAFTIDDFAWSTEASVPEPGTGLLAAAGLVALLARGRRAARRDTGADRPTSR